MREPVQIIRMLAAIATTFLMTLAFYPALKLPSRARSVIVALYLGSIACTPLLISADHPFKRFFSGLFCCAWGVKIFDLHIGAKKGSRPADFIDFFRFILNPAHMVFRKMNDSPSPSTREVLRHLAGECFLAAVAGAAMYAVFTFDW